MKIGSRRPPVERWECVASFGSAIVLAVGFPVLFCLNSLNYCQSGFLRSPSVTWEHFYMTSVLIFTFANRLFVDVRQMLRSNMCGASMGLWVLFASCFVGIALILDSTFDSFNVLVLFTFVFVCSLFRIWVLHLPHVLVVYTVSLLLAYWNIISARLIHVIQ